MKELIALVLILVFLLLSGFHWYWCFGGKLGLMAAIPTKKDATLKFRPPSWATALVAILLLIPAYFLLDQVWLKSLDFNWTYINYAIGGLFFLRAIGDFNYVGFFKKIKGTLFANFDTRYFTPLCVCIALLFFLLINFK